MTQSEIVAAFGELLGLPLAIARRGGSMRGFHFGEIRQLEGGSVGDYALHVQCPWRLDGPDGTVTGRDDLWEHATLDVPPDDWSYEDGASLQDSRLGALLGTFDSRTGSWVNSGHKLRVTSVDASPQGDVTIEFSGGFRLYVFPARSRGESWRLFRPHSESEHLVFRSLEA